MQSNSGFKAMKRVSVRRRREASWVQVPVHGIWGLRANGQPGTRCHTEYPLTCKPDSCHQCKWMCCCNYWATRT